MPSFSVSRWMACGVTVHTRTHATLNFPLLADFEPKGAVSRAYDAYRQQDGFSERAFFLIDRDGVIRWSYLSPVDLNPGADGILSALEQLSSQPAHAGAGA